MISFVFQNINGISKGIDVSCSFSYVESTIIQFKSCSWDVLMRDLEHVMSFIIKYKKN